jgi:hypothetical protein
VLVFMALATTLLTQPLLILVRRLSDHEPTRVPGRAESVTVLPFQDHIADAPVSPHPSDGPPTTPVADAG